MIYNGVSLTDRIQRGTEYYLISLRWDALGFFIIPLALSHAITHKNWKVLQALCALVIYYLYVLISASSATHMLGRFLSTPLLLGFFLSTFLIKTQDIAKTASLLMIPYALSNPAITWKIQTSWYQNLPSISGYIDTLWFVHNEEMSVLKDI